MSDLFSSATGASPDSLRRQHDRGARRPRAGPPPPRHVHRRHRRARASPPRRRSHRQCHGRSGRRLRHPHRGHARAGQSPERVRQRPRHPGRPAPQISRQVGARNHHDHAPLGREVRGQGLLDLGRPPRRRRQRRQCALDRDRRRGRARQEALPPVLLAGLATSKLEEVGAAPNKPRHHRRLHPRPGNLRRRRRFLARAPLPARPLQGLSLRRGRDPLALRPLARQRQGPRKRGLPVRQRPRRPSRRAAR